MGNPCMDFYDPVCADILVPVVGRKEADVTNPTRADLLALKQRIESAMRNADGADDGGAATVLLALHRMNLAHVEDHFELRSLYDPPYRREMYGRMAQLQIATARIMAHYGGE